MYGSRFCLSTPQGPANKYISLRDRRSRRGDTIFGAKFSIRLFRYYIKFLNKENMHTYSYGVLLYSDGRMPPLVALFADLYQFCTSYVKSNNDLCSADVLTIARNTRRFRVNSPQYQLAPESTRAPLVNSHPRTLTNSHPDQHVRLPRRGPWQCWPVLVSGGQTRAWLKSHSPKLSDSLHGRDLFLIFPNPLLKAIPIKYIVDRLKLCSFFV